MELLVVVSVIAVLTALLLPLVNVVRSNARGTKCLSNLRQIGLLTEGFVADNDGRYPGAAYNGSGTVSWHTILTRETLGGENVSISMFGGVRGMVCPSFRQEATSYYRCYSLNGYFCSATYGLDVVPPEQKHPSYTDYHLGLVQALVMHPAEKVLLQDTENSSGSVSGVWPEYSLTMYASPVGMGTVGNGGQLAFRHGGGMTAVYADLHGDKRMPARELNANRRYDFRL